MANNVQFQNNTKKHEKDSYVKGSNGIYYFQHTTGPNINPEQAYIDYIMKKHNPDYVPKTSPKGTSLEMIWSFYKKPEDMSYEDFVKAVDNYQIGAIGNAHVIPTGRDYTQVDINGNILVATTDSKLDGHRPYGNMIINGQTGAVIRGKNPNRPIIIYPADERTGFYPIEIYSSRTNKETGAKEFYKREYNFLSPQGHILSSKRNFNKVMYDEEEKVEEVARNYYSRSGTVVSDWDIYPPAYVVSNHRDVNLYTSALDALREYDRLTAIGYPTPSIPRSYFEAKFEERKALIDTKVEEIGMAYDNGDIDEKTYFKILDIFNQEYAEIEAYQKEQSKDGM